MPQMRKQGADANLVLRLLEHELGLAAFERDGIVGLDFHRCEGIAAPGNAVPHRGVIPRVEQRAEHEHGDKRSFHTPPGLYALQRPT